MHRRNGRSRGSIFYEKLHSKCIFAIAKKVKFGISVNGGWLSCDDWRQGLKLTGVSFVVHALERPCWHIHEKSKALALFSVVLLTKIQIFVRIYKIETSLEICGLIKFFATIYWLHL